MPERRLWLIGERHQRSQRSSSRIAEELSSDLRLLIPPKISYYTIQAQHHIIYSLPIEMSVVHCELGIVRTRKEKHARLHSQWVAKLKANPNTVRKMHPMKHTCRLEKSRPLREGSASENDRGIV